MAEPIGALRAEMSASAAQFEADMKRAKNAVKTQAKGMESAMGRVGRSFNNTIKSIFSFKTAAVAAAGAAGLAYIIKKAINTADELTKLSQAVGMPVEELSTLRYAADISGVSLETLGTGVRILSKNMQDTARGTGTAKDAFESLGINVKNNDGTLKSSLQIIKEIADKFKDMEDGTNKTAFALNILGRSGSALIPLLNQGSEGISKMQIEAVQFGLEIDSVTGPAAERFNDNLTRLKAIMQGLINLIMAGSLPTLEDLTNKMIDWMKINADLIKQKVPDYLDSITESIKTLGKTYSALPEGLLTAGIVGLIIGRINPWAGLGAAAFILADQQLKRINKNLRELKDLSGAEFDVGAILPEPFNFELYPDWEEDVVKAKRNIDEILNLYDETNKKIGKKTGGKDFTPSKIFTAQFKDFETFYREIFGIELSEFNRMNEKMITDSEKTKEEMAEHTTSFVDHEATELARAEAYYREIFGKELDDFNKMNDELKDKTKDTFSELEQVIGGWAISSADAIADFAMGAKITFGDMIDTMIRDMLRFMIYQQIMQPLFSGFGSIFGNILGLSPPKPKASGGPVRAGGLYEVAERTPEILNAGGRSFLMMGKHSGYIAAAMASGGVGAISGGAPTVNIFNNVGAEITTRTRETAQGPQLDVMIDQAVSKKLSQFGSMSNKTLRQNFNIREGLTKR